MTVMFGDERFSWQTWLLIVVASAVVPLLAPAYACAVILDGRGWAPSKRILVLLSLVAAASVPFAIPPLPDPLSSSSLTMPGGFFGRVAGRVWTTALSPAGPYALALAVLGAFFGQHVVRGRWLSLAALVVVATVAAGFPSVQPLRMLAPFVVLLWVCVAAGLAVLLRECRRTVGGYLAMALLVALVPGLQAFRTMPAPLRERLPRGHDTLTPAIFGRIVAALPDGAVFVREDASTDMLWRSLNQTWRRSSKQLRIADAASPELPVAAMRSLVFALPSAQLALQSTGFQLADGQPPQMAAVASALWMGAPCKELTQDWLDVTSIAAFEAVALVADDDASHGAVQMRAAGSEVFAPTPIGWPPSVTSAFSRDLFDLSAPDARSSLLASLDDVSAPHDPRLLEAPHHLALTFWRRAEAPRALMVGLGGKPTFSIARYEPDARQQIRLCAAFPHEPVTIGE
jgi:hypothetical protein